MINLATNIDFKNPYQVYSDDGADIILEQIITQFQRRYLVQILGEQEYSKFESDGNGIPTEDKWTRFLNGYDYQKDSSSGVPITIRYPGIKPVLTKLIFLDYHENTQEVTQKNGRGRMKRLNIDQIKPRNMQVNAWNDAVDEIKDESLYSPTVYNFLYEHKENYPDWDFTGFEHINIFNI